ncbi:MAG: hypothetical protein LUF87_02955 [Alistipes sp.]|nr:hypothetical protein [Alistipes sp.]
MFQLTGKDFYAVTAGTPDRYNSMTGSGGGMGVMFREPVIWCIFRADRYTLELLMQE